MFSDAMDVVGPNVRGIRGNWHSGTGELRDNLDSFNAGIQNGLSPEEAALNTFTGKMALRHGYPNVTFENLVGRLGENTDVVAVFRR